MKRLLVGALLLLTPAPALAFWPIIAIGAIISADIDHKWRYEYPRPKPFVKPAEIIFGISTSRTALEWAIVEVSPADRARMLTRLRQGYEATDAVSPPFAVAKSKINGDYFYVFRDMVLWDVPLDPLPKPEPPTR
jgi:hypothetical protein